MRPFIFCLLLILLISDPVLVFGNILADIQGVYRFFEVWIPKILPGTKTQSQNVKIRQENDTTFKPLKISIVSWPLFIQDLTKHFMRDIKKVTALDSNPWEVTEGYQTLLKEDTHLVVEVGPVPLDLAPVLAIDFGTSTCRISGYSNLSGPYLIHEMPTAVAVHELIGTIIVGQDAFDQYLRNCSTALIHIKPLLGRKFSDESIQHYVNSPCRNLVNGPNETIQARFAIFDKEFVLPIEMIASEIFAKLKEKAQIHLGKVVDKIVLTIPAGVSQNQKLATKKAAKLGGFTVLRTVHEPSMAAFSALQGKTGAYDIMVVDPGGGTTDFSYLTRNEKGQFIENVLYCDPLLGGSNFTAILADYLEAEFLKKTRINITQKDYDTKNPALWIQFTDFVVENTWGKVKPILIKPKIWHEAETLKRKFSESAINTYQLDYFGKTAAGMLHRKDLNEIFKPLLIRMKSRLETFKQMVGNHSKFIKADGFTNIHLYVVGGASKYPAVLELIEEVFGKKAEKGVDCSSEIARGAADYAHKSEMNSPSSPSSSSVEDDILEGNPITAIKESELYQKIAYSRVSMAVLDQKCADQSCTDESTSTIFAKQTKLPANKTLKLSSVIPNQEYANFRVYSGDDNHPKNLLLLDTYNLKLKKESRLVPLEFNLTLDDDGILRGKLCQMKNGGKEIEDCAEVEMDIQPITLPGLTLPGHEDL